MMMAKEIETKRNDEIFGWKCYICWAVNQSTEQKCRGSQNERAACEKARVTENRRELKFKLALVGATLAVIGVLGAFLAWQGVLYYRDYQNEAAKDRILAERGVKVSAPIFYQERIGKRGQHLFSGYSFELSGKSYNGFTLAHTEGIGTKIEIVYDPLDPTLNRPTSERFTDQAGVFRTGPILVIFLIAALCYFIYWVRNGGELWGDDL